MNTLIAIAIYGAYAVCWAAMSYETGKYETRQCVAIALLWPVLPMAYLVVFFYRWQRRIRFERKINTYFPKPNAESDKMAFYDHS